MISKETLGDMIVYKLNRTRIQHAIGRMLSDAQYILLCTEYFDLADELSSDGCICTKRTQRQVNEYLKRIEEM